MQNLRISIIGTCCTGKTTLAKIIAKRFHIPFIEENMRSLLDKCYGVDNPNELSESQSWEIETIAMKEQILAEKAKQFVTDTNIILFPIYLKAKLSAISSEQKMALAEMKKLALKRYSYYTHVFYLPPEIPFYDDGQRAVELRNSVDEAIKNILNSNKLAHTVTIGKLSHRVDFVEMGINGN